MLSCSWRSVVLLYLNLALNSASFAWRGARTLAQQHPRRARAARASVAKNKVVVTGLGTFTSLGHDADTFFSALLAGECGIRPLSRFDPELSAVKIASEVQDFDVTKFWAAKDAKRYDRCGRILRIILRAAQPHSGLTSGLTPPSRSLAGTRTSRWRRPRARSRTPSSMPQP
jgi:hypothetical protein